jgi:hypothetical protein
VRRADQIGGLLLLVFALCFAAGARQHAYWGPGGPGAGFLPFWLGVTMSVLAAGLVVGATRARDAGPAWLPDRRGLGRLALVLATTIGFVALLRVVGMLPGTVLFMVVLLRALEGYRWSVALGIGVAVAFVNYLVFTHWLGVPFPVGVLGL